MNYEQLEIEIANRLAPFATVGVNVIRTPEVQIEQKRPEPGKAQFTVMYAGSEYGNVQSTAQISQEESVFIAVLIESNVLRGVKGIYSLLSVIKSALVGFKPTGCHRLQAVKHHMIGSPEVILKDGIWQFQAVFKTTTLTVENFTEDLSVILRKITLIDDSDDETNVIPNPDN